MTSGIFAKLTRLYSSRGYSVMGLSGFLIIVSST
jgi:hypothetical protein